MTGALRAVDPDERLTADGLHDRLRTLVRPELQADVIVAAVGDAILGAPECAVVGCGRVRSNRQFCRAHYMRWGKSGVAQAPDPEVWARTADPMTRGRRQLAVCTAAGCRRGQAAHGLCGMHNSRWIKAGRPSLPSWAQGQPPTTPLRPDCRLPTCDLESERLGGYCKSHGIRWILAGRPSHEDFLVEVDRYGRDQIDLRPLSPTVRLEVQYALQHRIDAGTTRATPKLVQPALIAIASLGLTSLLDVDIDTLVAAVGGRGRKTAACSFLRHAVKCLVDLTEGAGWDSEFERDVWQLRRLPGIRLSNRSTLRFDAIEQHWLRQLIKRWARLRLSVGLSGGTVANDVLAVTSLAKTITGLHPASRDASVVTREVLETWLTTTLTDPPVLRARRISAITVFLRGVHQHGWAPRLPANAQIFAEDHPRRVKPLPRFVSEYVMAQLESDQAMARIPEAHNRLLTEIIIGTGMRVGDAIRLDIDALVRDHDNAAYLRYRNHKMNREAFVPIADVLAEHIVTHAKSVLSARPSATKLMPRQQANPSGTQPGSVTAYYSALTRWFLACGLHDETGRPARITPHQWRHTYATRLVNKNVPMEIVRQLLDHSSTTMTQVYGILSDRTVRDQWHRATKVNAQGEPVVLQPDSPLADAEWMKHNLSRATQALPNGYCGLPIQRSCPHANACLDCPVFVTTPQFLGAHIAHRDTTRRLLATAAANGQARVVEMNERVERNLTRVIDALQQADAETRSNVTAVTPVTEHEEGFTES